MRILCLRQSIGTPCPPKGWTKRGRLRSNGQWFRALTKTSWGLVMAAMTLAASMSFSQAFPTLMMWIPSLFLLKMYGDIRSVQFSVPTWAYRLRELTYIGSNHKSDVLFSGLWISERLTRTHFSLFWSLDILNFLNNNKSLILSLYSILIFKN